MSEAPQIEILPEDETTIWGYKELKKHGFHFIQKVCKTDPIALRREQQLKRWSGEKKEAGTVGDLELLKHPSNRHL